MEIQLNKIAQNEHKVKYKRNFQILKPFLIFYAFVRILKVNNLLLIKYLSTNGSVMHKHISKEILSLLKCGFYLLFYPEVKQMETENVCFH